MALYVVRHAKAGSRARWELPDHVRPLSRRGWAQAESLAGWLCELELTRLLSSPYTRCLQTLEPLSAKLGLPVEPVEALAEGMPVGPVLDLLAALPEGSVLCSHGDIIPDTVDALLRQGTVLHGEPDWRKGSTWLLEREDAAVVSMQAVPPPPED